MYETAALEALAELVNVTDHETKRAARLGLVGVWLTLVGMSRTFDAAYVKLEDEGTSYLSTAWAFIDAGRPRLAHWRLVLDSTERGLNDARA